jgi:hypothetical protein
LSVSPKLVVVERQLFKEETDVCYSTPSVLALQQAIPNGCPAKLLPPSQKLAIGLQALAGKRTVTSLADDFEVSRKFVRRQAATAQAGLDQVFFPPENSDDQVLFHLPVTKAWLKQMALGLVLICHSSTRGVSEFARDLLDVSLAPGTVHNYLHAAVAKARQYNAQQDLSAIAIAGLDEIFQQNRPVLVAADIPSTYCFLLSNEDRCDGDTWAVRLLEAADRGFKPDATVADFGSALRAGQEIALPGVPCRGDVFHALHEVTPLVSYLDNRAYEALAALDKSLANIAKARQQGQRTQHLSTPFIRARQAWTEAATLADDVRVLIAWLRQDVLAVSGLPYAERCLLYDFLVAELQAREALCSQPIAARLRMARVLLKNQRDLLLAFAAQLDCDLIALAKEQHLPTEVVRDLLDTLALPESFNRRWRKLAVFQERLGEQFHPLCVAVQELANKVVRASSVIENLNSRLRNYFFLRRKLGPDALALLQFFLNHRRFLRSEHPERVGKSPAELLTGQAHPHWLELLGYQRFRRN